jgi:hypothetical protein
MTARVRRRLPDVKTLYDILPKGVEGGKEFARIVDLLLFREAGNSGKNITLFSDVAGDYHGLDSFERQNLRIENMNLRIENMIGYQYKFYPSPLSIEHRKDILSSLKVTAEKQEKLHLKKTRIVNFP